MSMVNTQYHLPDPTWSNRLRGLAVLPLALLLARTKPVVSESIFRVIRHVTRVPSTHAAEHYLSAIIWAGRFWPGRVACLEISIGACLIGSLHGTMPVWCVGAKFQPVLHHAWIEALDQDGNLVPVAESEVADGWPYRSLIRV